MIVRLGHAALFVTDIEASRTFYVDVLGFTLAASEPGKLYLRGNEDFDLWTLALVEAPRAGLEHFSLRVDSHDELRRLEKLHQEMGLPTRRVPSGVEPGQGDALRVYTSDGHPIEFYYQMEQVPLYDAEGHVRLPMRSSHLSHGIPPARIDHVNLRVTDVDASLRYWHDRLDFSVAEYVERDNFTFAAWVRRYPFTHDVALVRSNAPSLHHVAYYVPDPHMILRAADLVSDAGFQDAIEFGPGRHGLGNAFFLYLRAPGGNRLEIYTGDYTRDLDQPPVKWSWEEYDKRGRLSWSRDYPGRFLETTPVNTRWP
jgi:catechol 2,3-dioxygenase